MKLKLSLVVLLWIGIANAQDPIFTQSTFIIETINPGFSGFEDNGRIHFGLLHRTQWPNLGLRVNTQYAFYNKSVESRRGQNFGFGFNAMRQHESNTNYSLNQFNANYAHRINLNGGWFFRPGVEVGMGFKSFNFGNLTLADQININDGTISSSSIDPQVGTKNNLFFLDISSGLVLEKQEFNDVSYWFGVSVKHLNRPNISFVDGSNLALNIFYSIHGAYKFPVFNDYDLMFTANYMQQGQFNRLDVGALTQIDALLLGITAATNPAKNDDNSHLLTSMNLFVGLEYTNFRFGLSYDFNTTGIGRTDGVYELSITYLSRCRSCSTDRQRKR